LLVLALQPGIAPEILINFNFDPAVLRSTCRGLVICDRSGFSKSLTRDSAALYTLLHNIIPNRHPTPIGKLQIVGLGPNVIRVTGKRGSRVFVLIHEHNQPIQYLCRLGLDRALVKIE
jgi:hypothetical protein